MTTSSKQQTTTVTVLTRYQIKRNGHVVYTALSSNGVDRYTVTLVNGKATGCDCPARKPCKHMNACEAKEAARNQTAQAVESEPVTVASPAIAAVASEPVTRRYSTQEQRKNASLYSNKGFSLMR